MRRKLKVRIHAAGPFLGPWTLVLESGQAVVIIIIIMIIIIIITESYLPIVKDSSAQGEAKEEEAALTFGQPWRQTYKQPTLTVLNIFNSPTTARGRAHKLLHQFHHIHTYIHQRQRQRPKRQ
jgi:hypothetical protein